MRVITTRTHGLADAALAVALTTTPWLMPFGRAGAETWSMFAIGLLIIAYGLFTTYEFGRRSYLSMRAHLLLDGAAASLLILSPWLFGFSDLVWGPHVALGLILGALSACTELAPFRARWNGLVGQ